MSWTYKGQPVETLPLGAVGFLYLIITGENRYYIGQCTSKSWKAYWGGGTELREYYTDHGKSGTRRIIIEFFDDEIALDRAETHLCDLVDAKENPKYYNLMDGGKANSNVSQKTKQKMSKSSIGKKKTPQHCRNISSGIKGRKVSVETRAKLSQINTGKKHTDETKQKMSLAKSGTGNGKSVLTENQAMAIKHVLNTIKTNSNDLEKIAEMFGVGSTTIDAIKYNRNWKHLPTTLPTLN